MRTKAQAFKAAKKVLERIGGNENWTISVSYNAYDGNYTYHLSFHKGLLTLYPRDDGERFFCLFTFDENRPGTGDPRFTENGADTRFDEDPKALVDRILQRVQDTVDREVYELDIIRELMASPKRRRPR